ncbi:SPFH domain-containing protein [Tundrisphaera sp. TA3]|uniref:SPFH domain-containing protein n=1 Tax=Tundrisphaera sp. TA3 TaxID=3435775 RepID=UPI003EBDE81D
MSRHDVVIIKDSHRGLLYEDGILKDVLPAGRHLIARRSTGWLGRLGFGRPAPVSEVLLIDIRKTDRTIPVPELLTADRATISASFVVQYRVSDPRAATQEVRNPGEMLQGEVQTAARRLLRGMTLDEIMAGRDEIGEELLMVVADRASEFGIELSDVDFKDLTLPLAFRETMDRAVFAKTARRALPPEGWGDDDMYRESADDAYEPLVASRDDEDRRIFPMSHDEADAIPFSREFAGGDPGAENRRYRAVSE